MTTKTPATKRILRAVPPNAPLAPDIFPALWAERGPAIKAAEAAAAAAAMEVRAEFGAPLNQRDVPWWVA